MMTSHTLVNDKRDIILNSLNEAQQEAVSAPLGNQLILAGAGSGKTRVLTHRMAWLIQVEGISPSHILAVTFTNKAANEMRSRVEKMLHTSARSLWIGTFHGLSHRFLRMHWEAAGLSQDFQILDADDQYRLIRRLIVSMGLNEDHYSPKKAQWYINKQKEEAREPQRALTQHADDETFLKVYQLYQETLNRTAAIDFADLLMKTYQLLQTNVELRTIYQSQFRFLLVDEFQDTNAIQYAWLKNFLGDQTAMMVVGDDDQSIYGWRGARIENIQRFSKDFPDARVTRLEQNYRSTATILKAANALISQNADRLGKNLWTADQAGDPIVIYTALDELEEAYYITNTIRSLLQENYQARQMAILYRSNAQSRVIEESLMNYGIAYRVYGGLRYFDRAEIKDALAYLRLVINRSDDAAFERIINTPTRGIGERTLVVVRDRAREMNISLWEALNQLLSQNLFSARAGSALTAFVNLINQLGEEIATLSLDAQIKIMLDRTGLLTFFKQDKKGLARVENLEELVNAAYQFNEAGIIEDMPPLTAFLSYAALESGEEQSGIEEDCVQLMTLHAAKGLEFPVVFLAGCEENLFPHYLCVEDPKALEEERRLCYVGITRAMRKIYMTHAKSRRMYGKTSYPRPSRFLAEIPGDLIQDKSFKVKVSRVSPVRSTITSYQENDDDALRNGAAVFHPIFGEGVVLACEGQGEQLKAKVRFARTGTKVLMASFLKKM